MKNNEAKLKTFNEWSNNGYLIIKGSKGIRKNDKIYFNQNQVKLKSSMRRTYSSSANHPWIEGVDDCFSICDFGR